MSKELGFEAVLLELQVRGSMLKSLGRSMLLGPGNHWGQGVDTGVEAVYQVERNCPS